MKKQFFIQFVATMLLWTMFLTSCASTTMLQSTPPGAKLYLNGEMVGTTPYNYSDTKIIGASTQVRLVAPGFKEYNGMLQRNEEVSVGAIIGGIFLLFPFLWTMKYKPVHNYELTPLDPNK